MLGSDPKLRALLTALLLMLPVLLRLRGFLASERADYEVCCLLSVDDLSNRFSHLREVLLVFLRMEL